MSHGVPRSAMDGYIEEYIQCTAKMPAEWDCKSPCPVGINYVPGRKEIL